MSVISREAAIRKLQDKGEEPMYLHTDEDWKCGLFMAEDIINDLPSAERVGYWFYKKVDDETGINDHEFCSECGFPRAQIYRNFCAVCGAKMRGDGDERPDKP